MRRRPAVLATLATALAVAGVRAQPAPPAGPDRPRSMGELKSLGGERFQIGTVVVDKRARRFVVPGRVTNLDKPLEFLAVTTGTRKAYESLLELDAIGSELNLACILIGLDRDPKLPAVQRYMARDVEGPRVQLSLAWTEGGKRRVIAGAQGLFNRNTKAPVESVDWVYIGSATSPDGTQFAADLTGILVSFIHDASALIDGKSGVGLGAYGSIHGAPNLPPLGSAIELVVEAAAPVTK